MTAVAGAQSVALSLAGVFPVVAFKLKLEAAAAVTALAAVGLLWFKYMVGVSFFIFLLPDETVGT